VTFFLSFFSAVCTNQPWRSNPKSQQRQCRCPQLDTKWSQFRHNSLIIERLSYFHIVCLSRDFSTNIQDVFVVSRKWPNSQSFVTSDIIIQQYQNISVLRVWIALVSVKVAISSEKHAASVVRVNVFYHYAVDLRFLLELVYLHLVHLKLLHHVRSWTIHLQPSEPQISTRIDIYSHCLLTQSCSGISAPI